MSWKFVMMSERMESVFPRPMSSASIPPRTPTFSSFSRSASHYIDIKQSENILV